MGGRLSDTADQSRCGSDCLGLAPGSLALQLPYCGLPLIGGELTFEASARLLEGRIPMQPFGAAKQAKRGYYLCKSRKRRQWREH